NGGTLLDVPPGSGINLVPVLRINGEEVARGGPDEIAEFQTRRLILTYPSSQAHLDETGQEATLENRVTVGDMFAVGLAYGRTSAEAIAASQVRLAQARDVTPPTAEPDQPQPEPGQQYYLPLVTQEGE